mgnify:CR=1 FL=1
MPGVGGLDGDFTMSSIQLPIVRPARPPWNKNRLIGQKRPLLPRQVWAIRARLELAGDQRNLVLFNLAIDSKLRGSDLVRLRVWRGAATIRHLNLNRISERPDANGRSLG